MRKHSCTNTRPFEINFLNGNNINISIINKGNIQSSNINKLIIGINDKTPEKKCQLKSINNIRIPSANTSKARNSYSVNSNNNSSHKNNNLFHSQNIYTS